jgi:FKBP-type peptidyl-prolyl cis-trans isomerase FkpA
MKRTLTALAFALIASTTAASDMTEEQKTIYALGANVGKQMGAFGLSAAELEIFKKGFTDSALNTKLAVQLEEYGPKIQGLASKRAAASGAKNAELGKAFAEKAAKDKGAEKTATGLIYLSLKDGTGASPAITDTVKVHYKGTLIDGKEFDSSYKRNAPAEFPLNGVIKCWGEGVQKMKIGGKARLICPASIAYGDGGAPGGSIPPGSTLTFEIELLEIKAAK